MNLMYIAPAHSECANTYSYKQRKLKDFVVLFDL